MISRLRLRAGPTAESSGLELRPPGVTVFVGPNNSGKSLALQEIESQLRQPPHDRSGGKIVADVALKPIPPDSVLETFLAAPHQRQPGSTTVHFRSYFGGSHFALQMRDLESYARVDINQWGHFLGNMFVTRLDGSTRLTLMREQGAHDLQQAPTNHLMALVLDGARRSKLRTLVHEAFGYHLVLDLTNIGQVRPRLSRIAPSDDQEEQGLHEAARRFHSAAQQLTEFSDGVRAFIGVASALVSTPTKVFLIDEPEAFLHPPLARRLGSNVARLAAEGGTQVFAATHSSEFLMGCIEAGVPVEVVRLTYADGVATARHLPSAELRRLIRDPLLRSTSALSALFHEGAVVTEAEADRAFYAEINARLTLPDREQASRSGSAVADTGATGTAFLHAQNKQTVHRLIEPLRRLGVAAAAIVDLDVLKEGGKNWTNLLRAAMVPEVTRRGFEIERAELVQRFGPNDMKRHGLAALDEASRKSARDLLQRLASYGIFAVDVGELERWLPSLGVTAHKPEWVVQIFDALGSDPDTAGYVRPEAGDVWEFLRRVRTWIRDPHRDGMRLLSEEAPDTAQPSQPASVTTS